MLLVSIIGDSISTFEGVNPDGYPVFYDRFTQFQHGMYGASSTWWAKVNQKLDAKLCVNDSYSGSKVSGAGFPAASSGRRTANLHDDSLRPDLILIYIGFNDFGNGVKIRPRGFERISRSGTVFFENAYRKMLTHLKRNYPAAKIICATLMRTRIQGNTGWSFPESFAGVQFEEYNRAIRRSCRKERCYLADVGALDMRYETLDGTHPTAAGHAELSDAWIRCLAELGLL